MDIGEVAPVFDLLDGKVLRRMSIRHSAHRIQLAGSCGSLSSCRQIRKLLA
jgi:hypothetical protein